jgi:hypothetical protein
MGHLERNAIQGQHSRNLAQRSDLRQPGDQGGSTTEDQAHNVVSQLSSCPSSSALVSTCLSQLSPRMVTYSICSSGIILSLFQSLLAISVPTRRGSMASRGWKCPLDKPSQNL